MVEILYISSLLTKYFLGYTSIENKNKAQKRYKIYKHKEKLSHHEKREDPYDFYI